MKRIYKQPFIYAQPSININGYGVITETFIGKGNLIEECRYTELTNSSGLKDPFVVYNIQKAGQTNIIQVVPTGNGCLYNHNNDPNSGWYYCQDRDLICFYALKNIFAGEEINVSYGAGIYFDEEGNVCYEDNIQQSVVTTDTQLINEQVVMGPTTR